MPLDEAPVVILQKRSTTKKKGSGKFSFFFKLDDMYNVASEVQADPGLRLTV